MIKQEEINFRDRKLVFVDLETTGLNPDIHEITEIGCLVVNARTLKEELAYEEKVKPVNIEKASREALEIYDYSEKRWKDAKPLKKVLEKIANIAPGGLITGWNVSFDWWFLDKAFRKFEIEPDFDHHRIDVMSIAYAKLYSQKKVTRLGLRKIAPYFGIRLTETHGAMVDIRTTYEIFKKLMVDEI